MSVCSAACSDTLNHGDVNTCTLTDKTFHGCVYCLSVNLLNILINFVDKVYWFIVYILLYIENL